MSELRKCPFCGSSALMRTCTNYSKFKRSNIKSFWVTCNFKPDSSFSHGCMGVNPSTNHYETEGKAIKAWNTRADTI